MKAIHSRITLFLSLVSAVLFTSCASVPKEFPIHEQRAYAVEEGDDILNRYAPIFIIENHGKPFNLIGTVKARLNEEGEEKLYVDPESPTIYVQKRTFETGKGAYTNLIYRVHFERVPFSLVPFYLVKGDNVGIFVIVTLNDKGEPLLLTTVHTCGCYIAFVPTSYMPKDAFPDGWDRVSQWVFGYTLPGLLNYPSTFNDLIKPLIFIRSGTHRIKDVGVNESGAVFRSYEVIPSPTRPMEELDAVPLDGERTTSFFETAGSRKGYVKGSHKTLERLLMSWWAFDWRIGEDKKLGMDKNDGIVFYTSLKPWARKASDLRDFPAFLNYWGWGL